jgi:hypothetical protein
MEDSNGVSNRSSYAAHTHLRGWWERQHTSTDASGATYPPTHNQPPGRAEAARTPPPTGCTTMPCTPPKPLPHHAIFTRPRSPVLHSSIHTSPASPNTAVTPQGKQPLCGPTHMDATTLHDPTKSCRRVMADIRSTTMGDEIQEDARCHPPKHALCSSPQGRTQDTVGRGGVRGGRGKGWCQCVAMHCACGGVGWGTVR